MRILLDGNDWLSKDYLPEDKYKEAQNLYVLDNTVLDSARSGGFGRTDRCPENCYRATIPGCDRTVLEENGEIPEMYYGMNLERIEWPEKKGWAFRKEFVLPDELRDKAHIDLTFMSIGYTVDGFLNDFYLGTHHGIFAPWVNDISDRVFRDGRKNVLVLLFDRAPEALPNHHRDRPADFAELHFCQMSFGWDWSRHLVPTGIFDHVELHGVDNVRINDVHFQSQGTNVKVTVEACCLASTPVDVKITLTPKGKGKPAAVQTLHLETKEGETVCGSVEFQVPDAEFWYPNGYGKQPLYELKTEVPGDEMICQVAFRDQRMIRNPGSLEKAYPLTFEFNGKAVFARGLDWVPSDLVLSRPDAAGYERLVRLAAEGGFNLFRVWGGGLLEKKEFYDACDRYGMIVWQEFPHACSAYPCDPVNLEMRKEAAEAFIRRRRNHPSLSLFCGGNEVLYYNETPRNPIYSAYGQLVQTLAEDRPYHISSPDLSRPGERDHGPWDLLEHAFWNTHFRGLASEVGCPGFAEAESIDRFIPRNDPWPGGQHWKYHFTFDTKRRPFAPIQENFNPDTKDRWQLSQASMFSQADELAYLMAHYRTMYPRSSGCFLWQYNESWPTNAFSIVDYYTMPKMAYYLTAKSNAPQILFLEDDSWCLKNGKLDGKLKMVLDVPLQNGEITCSAEDITGRCLACIRKQGDWPSGVFELRDLSVDVPSDIPSGILIVQLAIRSGGNVLWKASRLYGVPNFRNAFSLPDTSISAEKTVENGRIEIRLVNTGKYAAVNLRLAAEDVPFGEIFWKDNYLTLSSGETVIVTAQYTGNAPEKFAFRGWNSRGTF